MSSKRTAFTLIELLVVIAIIAILAAILFPVFARARAKAQQTTCLSNMKQFVLAALMYASDWNQKSFYMSGPVWITCYGGNDNGNWDQILAPYIRNIGVLSCPMGNPPAYRMGEPYWGCPVNYSNYKVYNYGPNLAVCGATWWKYLDPTATTMYREPLAIDAITRPAEIMWFAETFDAWVWPANINIWGYSGLTFPPAAGGNWAAYPDALGMTFNHQNGCNMNFCDGHAAWQTHDQAIAIANRDPLAP